MNSLDRTAMTEAEGLAEIAELLARGAQRLFTSECKALSKPRKSREELAASPIAEAACARQVQNPKSREPAA